MLQDKLSNELSSPKKRETSSQLDFHSKRFGSTLKGFQPKKDFNLKQNSVDHRASPVYKQKYLKDVLSKNNIHKHDL